MKDAVGPSRGAVTATRADRYTTLLQVEQNSVYVVLTYVETAWEKPSPRVKSRLD